ncbi:unnamed protein product [Caenorhabditis sp. 36 PRJEB53466]|nr:unnamed protein product [Caenorhabditis sp. 36 PRJEB53466]
MFELGNQPTGPVPPDRRLTEFTQYQRVADWLASIDRPDGMRFLDMESGAMMAFMKKLDTKTRSNLEKTCRTLLTLSRSQKPRLQLLNLRFTTAWNHDQFVEISAHFNGEHTFRAVFISKKKSPNWITGGWSTERNKNISSGNWAAEKLRLGATFLGKTSRYIEHWLKNFEYDVLRIKIENVVPGREDDIQQLNYIGNLPQLKVKKFILDGSNNQRFINNFMNALVPNGEPLDANKRALELELINVPKLQVVFHHPLVTNGCVHVNYRKENMHFTWKILNYVNPPTMNIVARKVPADAVNSFLKRWSRGAITEDFRYLHITETTQWRSQEMRMAEVLKGLRVQRVLLTTALQLRIFLPDFGERPSEIYYVCGPRAAFCVHSNNQFVFEVPLLSDLPKIASIPPIFPNDYDEFEQHRNRLYLKLFSGRFLRFFG